MRLNFFQRQTVPICLRHPYSTTGCLREQKTPGGVLTSTCFGGICPGGLCLRVHWSHPGLPGCQGLRGFQAPKVEQDRLVGSSCDPVTPGWHWTPLRFPSALPGLNHVPGTSPLPSLCCPEQPENSLAGGCLVLTLPGAWGWGRAGDASLQTHGGLRSPFLLGTSKPGVT